MHQLEAVLAHVDTGIAMTREGSFELVSLREMLGYAAHELQGRSTSILHESAVAHATFRALIRPSLEATGGFESEVELVRRDGQRFRAHVRGRAIAQGDRAEGSIWAIQDITQERARREQLVWSQAHVIAENIRGAVIDYQLRVDGQQFGVGASIGVVHMSGEFDSADAVLKAADTACYAAKQRGRNTVVVHGD